jgi:arylsulfatase A-like enzyme
LPELEALLNDSLVFERAYAVSPSALPSHAAWMSSVAPPVHLTVGGTFVADSQTMLSETLERLGHYRVMIGANDDLSADRGFAQGIDDLSHVGDAGPDEHARAVVDGAMARLTGRAGRWFLVADFTDPQAPYEPPREFLGELTPPARAPLAHLTHVWVGRVRLGKVVPDAREIAYVRRLYRGELQMVSGAVGELVEFLRRERRLDDAIVVMLGVHGEEFVEHGGAGHGMTLYEESLRVPLSIRAPDLVATGRITAPVDLLDLAPTLADLLGVPAPQAWQGESLIGLIDDPIPPPRLVTAYRGDGSRAAIVGDAKLWLGPGTAERFYDLAADPRETVDALPEGGVALRIVRTAVAWEVAHAERWRRGRWGTGANLRPAFALDQGM